MGIQDYSDLEVWKLSMKLAEGCYHVTREFPKDELFGMTSQIRRAAASIPANIAEGHGREHTLEFLHFISVPRGSLKELETHLVLSRNVGLLPEVELGELMESCTRVSQMLTRLRQSLEKRL